MKNFTMKNIILFFSFLFINKVILGQCLISCPSDIFQVAPAGQCGAVVNYTAPGSNNCRPVTLAFEGNPRFGQAYDEMGMHIAGNEHIDAPWPVAGGRTGARIHAFYTSIWTYKSGQEFTPISVMILTHPGDHQFKSSKGATLSPTSTGLFTFPNTPEWTNIVSLQWNNLGENDDLDIDNFTFRELPIIQIAGLPSGSTFPVGKTINTFEIKDGNGNISTCSFAVTVTDNEDPILTVPADITVNVKPHQCGAAVTYNLPGVTDNCGQGIVEDPIINGSFEDNYAGWKLSSTSSIFTFGILSAGQTIFPGGELFDYADNRNETQFSPGLPYTGNPTEGNKHAILLTNGPSTNRMYQDITLPNSGSLILHFDLQYRNHFQSFGNNQFFSVVLRDPISDAIITTLYKTEVGDPLSIPMTAQAINISAYAGRAVRLEMVYATFDSFYFDVLLDNIKISGNVSLRQTAGLPSGSFFPIGTTTNTFLATDAAGNATEGSFTVTVIDNESPIITVPEPITVRNDPNECGAVVNYESPVVTDNCRQDIIVNGSFENNYTGWNLSSTIASFGTFGILSAGETIPSGGLLFDYADNRLEQQTSPGLPYTGSPTEGNKLAIFLQNGSSVHRMYQDITLPNSGDLVLSFDLQYRNHHIGFDANNQFFSVVLRNPLTDAIIATLYKTQIGDPLSIPMTSKEIDISAYAGRKLRLDMIYASINFFNLDILLDNIKVSGDVMTITQTSGLPSGSFFPVGTTTNTFTATDASGNTGTSSFTVTVTDNENPIITLPAPISVKNDPNECGAVVTFDSPVVTDNCDQGVVIQDPILNGSFENNYTGWNLSSTVPDFGTFGILSAGQTIPPGGQLFDYADNRIEQQTSPGLPYTGNPTEGSKLAILLQNGPAIHRMYQDITLPSSGDLTLSFDLQYRNHATFDANSQFISVVLRNPATDVIIATLFKTQPGDPLFILMTTKTVDISIYAGQTVRLDMIFATITLFNLDVLLDNIKISGEALVVKQISGLPSGSLFPIGTTTNRFKATDASGNTAIDSFTVTVADEEIPIITVPADITVNKDANQPGAVVTYQQPVVTDNCKKDLIINGSFEDDYTGWYVSSTVAANGTFGILTRGETISFGGQLFDYADNRNEIQFSPGLPYTGNPTDGNKVAILLPNGPAIHRMYQDVFLPSSGSLTLSFDLQYKNHFQGFDANNQFLSVVLRNPATDVIIATLFKTQPGDPLSIPMTTQTVDISAYAGQSVRLDMIFATFNDFYFDVLLDNIKITGNVLPITQISGLPSGSVFPIGTTTNTFIATDESGNTGTGSFTVTVIDNQSSIITGAPAIPSKDAIALKGNPVKGLLVKAMPNPASRYFTLLTQSGSDTRLNIKVIDVLGRFIEAKAGVAANGTFQLGHNYRPGLYYLEVMQGKQRIIVKLIKQTE